MFWNFRPTRLNYIEEKEDCKGTVSMPNASIKLNCTVLMPLMGQCSEKVCILNLGGIELHQFFGNLSKDVILHDSKNWLIWIFWHAK